jgi:intracellular sulfur oxidation DsrE/DsrF family protein
MKSGEMKIRKTNNRVQHVVIAIILLAIGPVLAEEAGEVDGKPFAEAHIVLQLGDGDAAAQSRVLNVANNLIKHYGGPDFVDIEIVAYGPGISLLYPDNSNAERISSLLVNEIKFIGCMNTVETITRKTGKKPALIPATIPVKTGVAHLVERAGQGYVVIRP